MGQSYFTKYISTSYTVGRLQIEPYYSDEIGYSGFFDTPIHGILYILKDLMFMITPSTRSTIDSRYYSFSSLSFNLVYVRQTNKIMLIFNTPLLIFNSSTVSV